MMGEGGGDSKSTIHLIFERFSYSVGSGNRDTNSHFFQRKEQQKNKIRLKFLGTIHNNNHQLSTSQVYNFGG